VPLVYRSHPPLGAAQTAKLGAGEPAMVTSSVYGSLALTVNLIFVVLEEDGPRGPFRCSSRSYVMGLKEPDGAEVISYHWHPESVSPETGPHFHIGERRVRQVVRLHVPTPRVSVEEFVRTAIQSFGVEPTVDEDVWRPLLDESQHVHETWRSWHDRRDAPNF
jgi:hypothetical protein